MKGDTELSPEDDAAITRLDNRPTALHPTNKHRKMIMARLTHNKLISTLLTKRNNGKEITLDNSNKDIGIMQRNHGCQHCPYWGSSKCYYNLAPPKMHANGICMERLHEILDYAEMSQSLNGKDIKRAEVIENVHRHIILLETNLAEYRKKKYEGLLYKRDESGELHQIREVQDLDLKEIRFDKYEKEILDQINHLSMAYHQEMRKDTQFEKTLSEEKKRTKVFNIQEMNQYMNNAAKKLAELENDAIDVDFEEVDD